MNEFVEVGQLSEAEKIKIETIVERENALYELLMVLEQLPDKQNLLIQAKKEHAELCCEREKWWTNFWIEHNQLTNESTDVDYGVNFENNKVYRRDVI